ncbi:hypothetical protein [Ramlibacter sp.]|uniref:calcium-binding protein n=1 Tax=Ramlibacter sp. TaxID=1917967 RepID=UPI002D051A2E|nr:hypothetical protein [Ramlibacter sp.]HWI84068.1 hypothetical protein [Ramlibacter sp.]
MSSDQSSYEHGRFSGGTMATLAGAEFWPSQSGAGRAAVTGLSDGGVVVAWWNFAPVSNIDVYWQRFDAQGAPLGTRQTLDTYAEDPALAPTADGGFVAAWEDLGPTPQQQNLDIRLQRFDSNGAARGTSVLVNTLTSGQQWTPAVAVLADGDTVVTWWDEARQAVYARQFSSEGVALGDQFRVDALGSHGRDGEVAALADGGYVITWVAQDGSSSGIFAQRFDSEGLRVGGQDRINTVQQGGAPAITALADGGYFIAWTAWSAGISGNKISGQRFGPDGAAIGAEVVVNANGGSDPEVAPLSDGGFVVTWIRDSDIFVRRFDEAGMPTSGPFQATEGPGYEYYVAIAALESGFVVAWNSSGAIAGRMYQDVLQGTEGDNWLEGAAGDDSIVGLGGDDRLYGLAGDDRLDGGDGDDFMVGGPGNDRYVVDSKKDKVLEHGSDGQDTVFSSVSYHLDNNVEELTLLGSEAIDGTGNRLDNLLIGNSADNRIEGLGGQDVLRGGAGDDTLIGGEGFDVMIGDAGRDRFVLQVGPASEADRIYFVATEDLIILEGHPGHGMKAGQLNSDAFVRGTGALDANDRIIFDQSSGMLYSDVDGVGGRAQVAIAVIVGLAGPPTAENFVVA